jgi:hypothetical protein
MDAILEPHGTATVLLFRAQFDSELPTVGKLKRILGTEHIKIYKSTGYHSYVIRQIEKLLNHMRELENLHTEPYPSSTHVIILPLGHYQKVFAGIAYAAQLVGGFNLTKAALDELEAIDKKRWAVDQIAKTGKEIRQRLEQSQKAAERVGIIDPSLQAAIDQHEAQFDPNYGQGVVEEYQRQPRSWYERYTWRDCRDAEVDDGGLIDQNKDSEPLAA